MLYSQILAFILVMVVFEAYSPAKPALSLFETILGCLAMTAWLWAACRMSVSWFLRKLTGPRPPLDPARAARRLSMVLQAAALASVLLMITFLDLKAYLTQIPWMAASQTLGGIAVAALYMGLACLVWSQTHTLERMVLGQPLSRSAFVAGQARFVAPVIFPWFLLSLVNDLAAWIWPGDASWLNSAWGDLAFLALFALMIALMFPPLVRSWWGCRELPPGQARGVAQKVLDHLGVKVAAILTWPIMGGRLVTAGVVGLVPRLRYLLLTPALIEALDADELAAVVAHEAGHVKRMHMAKFMVLFMGFFMLAYALAEPLDLLLRVAVFWMAGTGWGASALISEEGGGGMLSLALALPMALMMILYLRFAVGYFMRNYERQADFFSLSVLGTADPLISSLEKIARLAGNIRDNPSWHHFSVAQRVTALEQAQADESLITAHDRKMRRDLGVYAAILALAVGLGGLVDYGELGKDLGRATVDRLIEHRLANKPEDPRLRMSLGILRFEQGQETQALVDLRQALEVAPKDPEVLNALAWVLATAKDHGLRDPREALRLASEAVRLAPKPHIFDTYAEALFVNGQIEQALAASRSALAANPKQRRAYYEEQIKRFGLALKQAR